jgi:hypothetical protein
MFLTPMLDRNLKSPLSHLPCIFIENLILIRRVLVM